jgi:hypothetical protein
MLPFTLLIIGLLFPVLSWVTAVATSVHYLITRRYASPVFIPIVGPIFLTGWIFVAGYSPWWIPAVWLLDIVTVAFSVALPRIIRDEWRTSRFTLTKTLRGTSGNESVILTLHRNRYVLRKSWTRNGGSGLSGLGEPGTFIDTGDRIELVAHHGRKRELKRLDDESYQVVELDARPRDDDNASLDDWRLHT